ncbi:MULTISPECIES: hypothetical protein [Calothrix]|nr:hypothetical protein [Calothrix anomala]
MCQSKIFHTADFEARSLPHRFFRRSCYPQRHKEVQTGSQQ